MIYCIAKEIEYDDDNHTLTCHRSGDVVQLTATASRLLNLLLQHKGDVVPRESILEVVWDAYNKKTSNSNLNQYVSMLRKEFSNIGVSDEVIVTVPRIGFMIPGELLVTKSETVSEFVAPVIQQRNHIWKRYVNRYSVFFIFYTVLIIAFSLFYIKTLYPEIIWDNDDSNLQNISSFKKCRIYRFDNNQFTTKPLLLSFISKVSPGLLNECDKGLIADVFVRHDDFFHVSSRSRDVMTICAYNENGTRKSCRTNIFINEKLDQKD